MPPEDNNNNVNFEQIEAVKLISVGTLFKEQIKEKKFFYITLPIIYIISALLLVVLYSNPILFFLSILIIIPHAYLYVSVMNKFIKNFASSVGFDYTKTAEMISVEGTLFNKGHSQRISDVVSGLYYNHQTRFFVFTTTEGSGKNQTTYQFSVLEVKFDTMLPDIILKNKKSFFYGGLFYFDNEKEIDLEGNFGKYFSIYTPEEFGTEALQIFTPDIMQMLIDNMEDINMEIFKDRVYIYHYGRVSSKDDIVLMYGLLRDIILKLEPTFVGMKGGVEAMSKYFKLT